MIFATVRAQEHRAPTDASIEILREMEQKALERVLAILPVTGNAFSGVVVRSRAFDGFHDTWHARFVLNGETFETEPVRIGIRTMLEPSTVAAVLRDELAKAIATKLLTENPGEWVTR